MGETKNPPLRAKGRRAGNKDDSYNRFNTRPGNPLQDCTFIVEADAIIGAEFFGLITTHSVYDPHVQRREWWPFKGGRRKGQFRWAKVTGEKRLLSIGVRRYRTPEAAAQAYHATRRALGLTLMPFASNGHDMGMMGSARLTPAGAASEAFAARLRCLGVRVSQDPLEERQPGEFGWVDYPAH
jgi:hypothetical protein